MNTSLNYKFNDFSDLDNEILEAHKNFSAIISNLYSTQIPAVSSRSLKQLIQLAEEKKSSILKDFNTFLAMEELSSPNFNEKQLLMSFLEETNQYVDEEFWKKYTEDTVVEIYSNEMVQTFRSFNFFKYTGYSLLDLSTFDWQILFERPKWVVNQMQSYVVKALQGIEGSLSVDIPEHILKQNYSSGLTDELRVHVCMVKFDQIATVRDSLTSAPKGLIVTSKAKLMNSSVDKFEEIAFI